MANFTGFPTIVSAALTTGYEVSLYTLIDVIKPPGLLLEQVEVVRKLIAEWSLDIKPPLTEGDLLSIRVLHGKTSLSHTPESVTQELQQGEMSTKEFKSSLLYDHNRASSVPTTPLQQLKSDAVLHSSLKSIAAFLNTSGGILFIGVTDDAHIIGLCEDCKLWGHTEFDADKWQLEFRNYLTGKFKDGAQINDYVTVHFIEISQSWIARIQVLPRKRLSFLKNEKTFHLYRRQGNRTMEVLIEDIEEFLDARDRTANPQL